MTAPKKILFIINPISGVGKKNTIPPLIESYLAKNQFQWEIAYTKKRKHGFEIAAANKTNFNAIVAVGGDGSVNEIGSALIHSNCALGIIPCGSGNGLARHLKIPLKAKAAIQRIAHFNTKKIDTGTVNNTPFIGTCGFGFDGYIANKFDKFGKRGFLSYVKLVTTNYSKYVPPQFTLKSNELSLQKKAFLCSIANSSEFGNGFSIAPNAKINDAQFELILLERFPAIEAPIIVKKFFSKNINTSKYYHVHPFTKDLTLTVSSQNKTYFHIDGEPFTGDNEFTIRINPASLLII